MIFKHGRNRAAGPDKANGTGGPPTDSETTDNESGSDHPTDNQRREWRRWIIEEFLPVSYGVVPVDHLVETILDREPEAIDRSTVRAALTKTVLPAVDRESVLEYDVDRGLLIKYDN